MIIDIANCKLKMVVIIATALALGVGAVAACVVPWLYCNPNDSADDDREAAAIRDNAISPSRSGNEHNNKSTATQVRINGFSFVKVVHIATESSSNHDSEKSTNERGETGSSVALEPGVVENSANEQTDLTDQTKSIRRRNSGPSDFSSIAERSRNSENASGATNESSGSSESAITNIRITERSLEKSVSSDDPSLMIKIEEILTDTTKSSMLTDESSTGATVRTSSCISTLDNSAITDQTDEQTSEPTNSSYDEKSVDSKLANNRRLSIGSKFQSSDRRIKATFFEPGMLDRIEEDTSTSSQKIDPLNSIDDSFIETTNEASSSQESKNSSGQTKLDVVAIIETSKSPEGETISEAPPRSPSSQNGLSKIDESSYRKLRDEVSSTSTISSWNSRSKIISAAVPIAMCPIPSQCGTHNTTQSPSYSRSCNDTKKISLFRKSLSRRIKRFFHGRQVDKTPRSSHEDIGQPLYTESVQSLSAGKKVPAGNSTRISEDQRPLEMIRGPRSTTSINYLSTRFEDPRILDPHPNETDFGLQIDEEPLDLSIHSSPCNDKMENQLSSKRNDRSSNSGFTKEILREVKQRLITRASEEGTIRSDSIKFCDNCSKSFVRDENQNVRSDSLTIVERGNIGGIRNPNSDSDANVIDQGKTKKKRKKQRSLFNFSKKNRSTENDKVSSFGSKRKDSDSVLVECQRNSTVTSSKSNNDFNAKVESISESPADSYHYFSFNNTVRDDEPCTEL